MRVETSQPKPTHRVSMEPEEVEEALLAWLRKNLKGSGVPAPKKLVEVFIRREGSQSQQDFYLYFDDSGNTLEVGF